MIVDPTCIPNSYPSWMTQRRPSPNVSMIRLPMSVEMWRCETVLVCSKYALEESAIQWDLIGFLS